MLASARGGLLRLRGRNARPCVLASVLAGVVLLLQGCVYLRLLEVRSQLSDFEEFVSVEMDARGMTLQFEEPTLRSRDLKHLGVVPLREWETNRGLRWEVQMRKRYKAGKSERGNFDLWTELSFTNDRLESILIPRAYVECFSAELFLSTIKALGESQVQTFKKAVLASPDSLRGVDADVSIEELRETFGIPYEQRMESGHPVVVYSYEKKEPKDLPEEERSDKTYGVTYVFDESGEELLSASTRAIKVRYSDELEVF